MAERNLEVIKMNEVEKKVKIGLWRQRIGYGSSDFACNLIWQMISLDSVWCSSVWCGSGCCFFCPEYRTDRNADLRICILHPAFYSIHNCKYSDGIYPSGTE